MSKAKFHIPDDRGKLYEVIHYPAGEIQTRLTAEGRDKLMHLGVDGYEITANPIPDVVELAQLTDAINRTRTFYHRALWLPYLPFARADRVFVPGDCNGFVTFMTLVHSMLFTSIWTFDAHNVELAKMWNVSNVMPTDTNADQIVPILKKLGKRSLVIVLPDEGAAKRYHEALKQYKLPVLVASKVRDPKTGALTGFKIGSGVKQYKKALIIDDICDGGGTFIGLSKVIKKLNPKIDLSLYVSHGIFSKGVDVLYEGGISTVYVSDYSIRGNQWTEFDAI